MILPALKFFPLLFLALLLSTPACGADPPEVAADALQQGIELYRAGKPAEALNHLRSFVVRNSESPLLPQAYCHLARILVESDKHQEALLYLDKLKNDPSAETRLLKGAALVGSGRFAEGVALLQGVEETSLSPADQYLRLVALARGHAGQNLPMRALSAYYTALSLPVAREPELLHAAHPLLLQLTAAELEEAIAAFAGTPLGEDARLQKAERLLAAGKRAEARQLAAEVVKSGIRFPDRQAAVQLLERLVADEAVERAVGVILPLTGRFATFGTQVRRGMELALEARGAQGVRFLFVDADGEAEKSAQAVADLVNRERVMAIVGPLTGGGAAAAASRAQQERVPLLTLSQREGLAEQGGYVFRDCLTPRLQVQSLVTYAMTELKLTEFAVLFPENKLGREMTELFAREVAVRGGKVTDRQAYAESTTDFRQQVRLLQRRDPAVPDDPASPPAKPHFQALFIPDYAERVGLIAPQLIFYGLEGIQLLGINGWNSSDLIRVAGKYVEGAIFVDGFFLDSPAVSDFVRLYIDRFGEEPGILEAQGFEAAAIMLSLLEDPAIQDRDSLRRALAKMRNYRGLTGTRGFDEQGEAVKTLFLLQVQNGAIVQVN